MERPLRILAHAAQRRTRMAFSRCPAWVGSMSVLWSHCSSGLMYLIFDWYGRYVVMKLMLNKISYLYVGLFDYFSWIMLSIDSCIVVFFMILMVLWYVTEVFVRLLVCLEWYLSLLPGRQNINFSAPSCYNLMHQALVHLNCIVWPPRTKTTIKSFYSVCTYQQGLWFTSIICKD